MHTWIRTCFILCTRTHTVACVFAALLAEIGLFAVAFEATDGKTVQKLHSCCCLFLKLNILVVVIWIWFMFTNTGFIVLVWYYHRWRSSETEVSKAHNNSLAFSERVCCALWMVVVWASQLNYNYFHKFPSFMNYLSSFSLKWLHNVNGSTFHTQTLTCTSSKLANNKFKIERKQ